MIKTVKEQEELNKGRDPEYLYTQEDINHILQENKKLKDEIEDLKKQIKKVWKS